MLTLNMHHISTSLPFLRHAWPHFLWHNFCFNSNPCSEASSLLEQHHKCPKRIHPTCKSEKQTSILYNATVNFFLVLDHIPAIHVRIQQVLVTAWKCFLPSNLQFTCKDFHLTTKFWHNTTLCVNNSTHLLSSETTGVFYPASVMQAL